jgi:predicted RNA-binding Zn ribbon-like protein
MKNTKTKQSTDWKEGFLFLGNDVVLDLLNTHPVTDVEAIELLPDFNALLQWLRVAGLVSSREAADLEQRWTDSVRAQRTVQAIRELREKIRKGLLAWERGGIVHRSTIDELNRLMASHPMRTRLQASGKELLTQPYFVTQQPEDLVAPLAYGAAQLFSKADRTRVRKCDHCVLHFHDTSKKGTRRWCSMRICGNRLKVAAYAARQRERREPNQLGRKHSGD